MEETERIYAPSKYIKDFLEEMGWTQADLALVLGWLPVDVSNLILRKKKLTPEIAKRLATVFEKTTPQFWTDVEAKYVLSQSDEIDEKFIRRSELFKRFPVIEMMKRGWINKTDNIDELTNEVLNFFRISSLSETPKLPHAARKSTHYASTTMEQFAWMFRAYTLAPAVMVKTFSTAALDKALVLAAPCRLLAPVVLADRLGLAVLSLPAALSHLWPRLSRQRRDSLAVLRLRYRL